MVSSPVLRSAPHKVLAPPVLTGPAGQRLPQMTGDGHRPLSSERGPEGPAGGAVRWGRLHAAGPQEASVLGFMVLIKAGSSAVLGAEWRQTREHPKVKTLIPLLPRQQPTLPSPARAGVSQGLPFLHHRLSISTPLLSTAWPQRDRERAMTKPLGESEMQTALLPLLTASP